MTSCWRITDQLNLSDDKHYSFITADTRYQWRNPDMEIEAIGFCCKYECVYWEHKLIIYLLVKEFRLYQRQLKNKRHLKLK